MSSLDFKYEIIIKIPENGKDINIGLHLYFNNKKKI